MNWEECLVNGLAKRKNVDEELIDFLILESGKKLKTADMFPVNEISASTKLCIVYDSLREILEAIAIKNGYKIYNHECYSGLLDVVLSMKEWAMDFDKFRRIRNSVNYYGKAIGVDDAKNLIYEIVSLRNKLARLLK